MWDVPSGIGLERQWLVVDKKSVESVAEYRGHNKQMPDIQRMDSASGNSLLAVFFGFESFIGGAHGNKN